MKNDPVTALMKPLRDFINKSSARFVFWKAQRKAYRARTLLLADNWDGSVQQFYHFFLGYFMPMCAWLCKHGDIPIAVRDCGPMNIWFHALQDTYDIEILPPGSALHMVVGKRMKYQVLRGLDNPEKFNARDIKRGGDSIRQALGLKDIDSTQMESSPGIVIVDRASSEDFYHLPESETHMSGQERRSVPNLAELPNSLGDDTPSKVVDLARMAPREQIQIMQSAHTLVGQHGAGLTHMIWMGKPSHVVEIAPPLPSQVEFLFQRLAETLGIEYSRIPQDHVHASVELGVVAEAISRSSEQPN